MRRAPFVWVPSLYFAEGVPYVLVNSVAVVMFKNLGVDNTDNAVWTSLLMWPWVLKPLWSPLVDCFGAKKHWVVAAELAAALLLGFAAGFLDAGNAALLVLLALLAFVSATHDVAADGLYIIALAPEQQSLYSGVRNSFYRISMIASQGLLVMLAGWLIARGFEAAAAWRIALGATGTLFLALGLFHGAVLPETAEPAGASRRDLWLDFAGSFREFFRKKHTLKVLAFILLYRLGESQLAKLAPPFMLDSRTAGGLGISTEMQGLIYGTIGVISMLAGGVLGGVLIARIGLKKALWPFAFALNLPNLAYVWMSAALPANPVWITVAVALEQFGYGLGFSSFMMVMLYFVADSGRYRSSHYALLTGFMALGMMLPGAAAGAIQSHLGYENFFIWVCAATIPGFLAAAVMHRIMPPDFARLSAR